MRKLLVILIGFSCLLGTSQESYGQFWKFRKRNKAKVVDTVKNKTKYDKLFSGKKVETKKGLITIHKMDSKLFFEFPLNLLDKDMLLTTVVSEISDNSNALVGQKPHDPLHIKFQKKDSTLYLSKVTNHIVCNEDDNIIEAVKDNNIDPFIESFKIKAYNNDSTAVVIDVTDFFVSDNSYIDPFYPYSENTFWGFVARMTRFQSDESCLDEIKSFENNISIKSYLSYRYDLNLMGMAYLEKNSPFTALVTRSIILLPEHKMRPRFADPRINFFNTPKIQFSSDENKTKIIRYAHRWRLEPKDIDAYKRGELVEPVKPIVYYIDNAIPTSWRKYVKQGVLDWNKAFEAIGFKNAVVVKDFPTREQDPEFDFANLKYSCVKYVPTLTKNSMGPSWVDPRTGEIINGSVYLYHNIIRLVHDWKMIQTGAVDKRARRVNFGEKYLGESIRYVVAHEIGHTLGLMHNMSASNAIPTEKLRDPQFTQKYGTTYSIMDYARNNYVAQPGDLEKGVKLTPPNIGVYDYFSIKWGYSPILEAKSATEEISTLDRWITEKSHNPIYRYGKQQLKAYYDPRSQTEDLGDDAIKSSTYGIKNLKRILPLIDGWVKHEDKDFSYVKALYITLVNQYSTYLNHVMNNIGGIYVNEVYRADNMPTHKSVSKEKQKAALKFILSQIDEMDWLRNKEIAQHAGISKDVIKDLKENTFKYLLFKTNYVQLSSYSSEDPYTAEQFFNDIYNHVFARTIKGQSLKKYEMDIQNMLLGALINTADMKKSTFTQVRCLTDNSLSNGIELPKELKDYQKQYYGFEINEIYNDAVTIPEKISGFGWQNSVDPSSLTNIQRLYYKYIKKTQRLIKSKLNTGNRDTRMHYDYLLFKINQALD